ncbi:MAG: DUF1499 domain-containing protein [Aestuariivita sp.]|nr:DUF1499 domain-containing protein [Aestuariivita sp.]
MNKQRYGKDPLDAELIKLKPCKRPSCVSSQADRDSHHYIEPIKVEGDPVEIFDLVKTLIAEWNRSKIVVSTENYVHVLVRTRIGFIDDVEFLFRPGDNVIHVRSAARMGYFDWGVNRARIEALRSLITK